MVIYSGKCFIDGTYVEIVEICVFVTIPLRLTFANLKIRVGHYSPVTIPTLIEVLVDKVVEVTVEVPLTMVLIALTVVAVYTLTTFVLVWVVGVSIHAGS